jgi:hypothetical protein
MVRVGGCMWISVLAVCLNLSFVTADRFRESARHVGETVQSEAVTATDIIFIKTADLGRFFQEIHPRILHPYILISHLTDEEAPGAYVRYLEDPKLLAWFAVNFDGNFHPKLHPIPLGVAPQHLVHGNLDTLRAVREETQHRAKSHLLFMNFTIQTYAQERWQLFKQFAEAPFCFRTGKKPFAAYLRDLAASKFVLAPRGTGLDTYRLWEALYLGSIPIVKTSSLDILYADLPVLIVKDWEEVTEEFLHQKYAELQKRQFSLEKLDFSYWQSCIFNCQK